MSAEAKELYDKAREELFGLKNAVKGICETLQNGCSLEVAYEIIDRCWLPNEANRIKTGLSSDFPERNGRAILDAPLSGEVSMLVAVPATAEYLSKVFPEIIAGVEALYAKINELGTSDGEALEQFNQFRKEPARFIDYVKDLWYPQQDQLVEQRITSWEELCKESESVENGKYLIMTDYRSAIRDAQQNLDDCILKSLQQSNIRLTSIQWKCEDLIGLNELIMLFSDFIDRKLAA